MNAPDRGKDSSVAGSTRRQFLLGGTAAGVGAAAALGLRYALTSSDEAPTQIPLNGDEIVPFYGAHQAGIGTDAQAHAVFVALDLHDDVNHEGLRRMMMLLSDAARLTQGMSPLADSEPELSIAPARLTVTFGFGSRFVTRARGAHPQWLRPLPAFAIDKLRPEYCDGDLLIQVASDDPLTVAHAARMLLKDARTFTSIRWMQNGFRRAHGTVRPGTTMRNLFGQVDGTVNPIPDTADFETVVWNTEGWLTGGTSAVIRRISMDLDKWDRLDRSGRDQTIGRYQSNGAPLTSSPHDVAAEHEEPDFEAKTPLGFSVIPDFSHMARARPVKPSERILRRGYNYQEAPMDDQLSDSGLIFVSYQADVEQQFVPIQRRLDELDLLNEWTTPVGSAVFAIPPGCSPGGFIGDTLL